MLIDRRNWKAHRGWFFGCLLATAGATAWYFADFSGKADWPDGRSQPGFLLGIAGGLIILFEFLLWPRKWVRSWRLGRAQTWLRAHIWLGLLTVPLIILHSGFRFGGTFTTVLLVIFFLVIASGVWGLVMQQFLPRRMLEDVTAETIYSQIEHVSAQFLREAGQLVHAACGSKDGVTADAVAPEQPAPFVVIGAVRSAGRVQGRVLQTQAPRTPVPNPEPLRDFYEGEVVPFLRGKASAASPLRVRGRAAAAFRDLRVRLDPAAHGVVGALEDLCEQRRQFDVQARLHRWLHNWLCLHVPLSAALVVLMVVHVWYALKWW